jgi:hypothetical protein
MFAPASPKPLVTLVSKPFGEALYFQYGGTLWWLLCPAKTVSLLANSVAALTIRVSPKKTIVEDAEDAETLRTRQFPCVLRVLRDLGLVAYRKMWRRFFHTNR